MVGSSAVYPIIALLVRVAPGGVGSTLPPYQRKTREIGREGLKERDGQF
jgi:hypothetical protein